MLTIKNSLCREKKCAWLKWALILCAFLGIFLLHICLVLKFLQYPPHIEITGEVGGIHSIDTVLSKQFVTNILNTGENYSLCVFTKELSADSFLFQKVSTQIEKLGYADITMADYSHISKVVIQTLEMLFVLISWCVLTNGIVIIYMFIKNKLALLRTQLKSLYFWEIYFKFQLRIVLSVLVSFIAVFLLTGLLIVILSYTPYISPDLLPTNRHFDSTYLSAAIDFLREFFTFSTGEFNQTYSRTVIFSYSALAIETIFIVALNVHLIKKILIKNKAVTSV